MNTMNKVPSADPEETISIPEFCRRFRISTPTYYKMRAEGCGPRELRMAGQVVRIRPEAIRDWIADRESPTSTAAQRAKLKARSEYALSGGR
ncbi:helix-turn-helix domain-containing protein [Mesorhizobium sp. AA22]|uniref:helix-turn-helix transcriptional regulator n=1 Tax=Mesorhizobium sp. AA22 TaxID=1854057 RepID=UPI0007ED4A26|nr:helix-turn-helix domain-containing protein [Mesorhizobium sp. AA22]QIA23279.1 helix-turn-helix domain-containing protein [Mesorhizobium sp. AA22]